MSKQLTTLSEAARDLNISHVTLGNWIYQKKISKRLDPHYKGRRFLIDPDEVREYIKTVDYKYIPRGTYNKRSRAGRPLGSKNRESSPIIALPLDDGPISQPGPINERSRAIVIITETTSLDLKKLLSEVFS